MLFFFFFFLFPFSFTSFSRNTARTLYITLIPFFYPPMPMLMSSSSPSSPSSSSFLSIVRPRLGQVRSGQVGSESPR
ncbi:hypothetical protein GGR50DRAFT_537108 [Xylaria sp. CBS 124048]|nr:hypothetical protein GGR50DRAFT_537108 [Xylaria sp. CBS 124048]